MDRSVVQVRCSSGMATVPARHLGRLHVRNGLFRFRQGSLLALPGTVGTDCRNGPGPSTRSVFHVTPLKPLLNTLDQALPSHSGDAKHLGSPLPFLIFSVAAQGHTDPSVTTDTA